MFGDRVPAITKENSLLDIGQPSHQPVDAPKYGADNRVAARNCGAADRSAPDPDPHVHRLHQHRLIGVQRIDTSPQSPIHRRKSKGVAMAGAQGTYDSAEPIGCHIAHSACV